MADTDDRKNALIAELARARSRAAAYRQELTGDLNVTDRFKSSIAGHRGVWLGTAALLGLIIAKLPPRTKKVVVTPKGVRKSDMEQAGKAGLFLAAAKMILDMTKPMIMAWATKRISQAVNSNGNGSGRHRYN